MLSREGGGNGSGIEEGETASRAFKRVSGIWGQRQLVVFVDDRKDCVLLRLSSVGVCKFAGL